MFDRHWLGDIALAVLLVLPLAGLARTQPITRHHVAKTDAVSITTADRSPEGRISLFG
ncbi:MAG: hypothetical protein QOF05_1246 [Sphingomonadales bacterium]|jgi:hypothetical protein|nr:hypothetical protein [Sphingomonadales bacterium]